MKINTKTIIAEMVNVVENNDVRSPGWWIDQSIKLNAMWGEWKDEMNKYEMAYKEEMVALIEAGKKVNQAALIVESKSENYKEFCFYKGRDKMVEEFIRLGKIRGWINDNF